MEKSLKEITQNLIYAGLHVTHKDELSDANDLKEASQFIPWIYQNGACPATFPIYNGPNGLVRIDNNYYKTGNELKVFKYYLCSVTDDIPLTETIFSFIEKVRGHDLLIVNIDGVLTLKERGMLKTPIHGGKSGIVNYNADIIIPIEYDYISFYKDFISCKIDSDNRKIVVLFDYEGNNLTPFEMTNLEHFLGEYYIVQRTVEIDGNKEMKYGIMKLNGEILIPSEYDSISVFASPENNILLVGKHEIDSDRIKHGLYFIDIKSCKNWQIKYDFIDEAYESLSPRSKRFLICNIGGSINKDGVFVGGKYGLVDYNGNEIIPIIYDSKLEVYNNFVIVNKGGFPTGRVTLNGAWGLINLRNEVLIDFKYKQIELLFPQYRDLENGLPDEAHFLFLVAVQGELEYDNEDGRYFLRDPKYGVTSSTDQIIIPCIYSEIEGFGSEFIIAYLGLGSGYIYNKSGHKIFPDYYIISHNFESGMISLTSNRHHEQETFYMDMAGRTYSRDTLPRDSSRENNNMFVGSIFDDND